MASTWGGLNWILEEAEKRKGSQGAPSSTPAPAPFSEQGVAQYIQQQQPRPEARPQEGPASLPTPPLPVYRPMVDPVVGLKRETSVGFDYTPEAAEQLYQTPVRLEQQGRENRAPDNPAGQYRGGKGIMVWAENPHQPITSYSASGQVERSSREAEILAHEFGHKWYFENMPEHVRNQWGQNWVSESIPPAGQERLRVLGITDPYDKSPVELYAMNAEKRGLPEVAPNWDKYYAGLHRGTASEWEPPPRPPRSPTEIPFDVQRRIPQGWRGLWEPAGGWG